MIWIFIKKGTNGDRYAPTIVDENIKNEFVASLRAKEVLYKNNNEVKIKISFPDAVNIEPGNVVYIESFGSFYQVKSVSYSELPYVIINMVEVK